MGASPLLDGANQGVNNAADEIPAYKLQNIALVNQKIQNIKKDTSSSSIKKNYKK